MTAAFDIAEAFSTLSDAMKVGGGLALSVIGMYTIAQIILKFQTGVVGPQQQQLEFQRQRIDDLEADRVRDRKIIERLEVEHAQCQTDYRRVIALLADHGIAVPPRS